VKLTSGPELKRRKIIRAAINGSGIAGRQIDFSAMRVALLDALLCFQELLDFTRRVFSALRFALCFCTIFFLTFLSFEFGLCSPSSFGV